MQVSFELFGALYMYVIYLYEESVLLIGLALQESSNFFQWITRIYIHGPKTESTLLKQVQPNY